MLNATDLLGGEAYDRDGHFVGHVTELFIEPADQPNRVARVLLGRGKYLPWSCGMTTSLLSRRASSG